MEKKNERPTCNAWGDDFNGYREHTTTWSPAFRRDMFLGSLLPLPPTPLHISNLILL